MLLGPNWFDTGTKAQLEGKYGFKVRIGWTETTTDTLYCSPIGDGYYRVQCWNSPDVRQKLALILGMPVHREVITCKSTTSKAESGDQSPATISGKLKRL